MNMFFRLQTDPTLNKHQRRASLAKRLIVLSLCGVVFAFTAGNVVLGLFSPACCGWSLSPSACCWWEWF